MKMKRGDMILIAVLIVAALGFLVPRYLPDKESEGNHNVKLTADITVDGQFYQTVELTEEEQIIEINTMRGKNVLRIYDYGIEMKDADCPDWLCIEFGFITKPRQSIVCLPHRVMVEINDVQDGGEQSNEPDAVVS